jgi:cytochrome c5
MRRLLLLLLALVLSMQMSWAATHFCDDARLVELAVAAAEQVGNVPPDAAAEPSESKGEKIADACCGAAHVCHGLHHLMGQADPAFGGAASTQMPAPCGAAPPSREILSRIDRPNWSAA